MHEPDTASADSMMTVGTSSTDYDMIITKTKAYVRKYMLRYDSSHDYDHIKRVVNLALHLHEQEVRRTNTVGLRYSRTLIILAALLHDVGDRKYHTSADDPTRLARNFLLSVDCPPYMAQNVQDIVNHVSYSHEIKNPTAVTTILARLPELSIVQDADRLDAIGAVGVGRAFTYSASVRCRKVLEQKAEGDGMGLSSSMNNSIEHFVDKLEQLEGMMKTKAGKEMAKQRTERLRVFRGWWEEEVGMVDEVGGE